MQIDNRVPPLPRLEPRTQQLILSYFVSATSWLVLGTLIGLLMSVKMPFPDFLGGTGWISFGRLRPVHTNMLFWGWASTALVGLALYVVPRVSRAQLYRPELARWGLWIWNFTVAWGSVVLLAGQNNGDLEYREYPWYVSLPFAAFVVLAAIALIGTVARRHEKEIYISSIYIGAGFLWTIVLWAMAYQPFLQNGAGGIVVQGYYMHSGVGVWFTPLALGSIYYFLPRLLNKPVYSYALGLLGFWTLALYYPTIGVHHFLFAPIPWWLQTVAVLFSVGMMLPVWSATGNLLLTCRGEGGIIARSYPLLFMVVGITIYGLGSLQGTLQALRSVNIVTHFTDWTVAHAHLMMYGFVSYLAWGGIYALAPRLTGHEPKRFWVGMHFWLATVGIFIYFTFLTIGGAIRGVALVNGIPFVQSITYEYPYWIARIVGGMLMFLSHVVFAFNVAAMRPSNAGRVELAEEAA
ncbi:MAG TPA: cbb3-type cytochrome c oxidase subunit I [Oscillatoriaceae cyanobacterium]